MHTHVLTVDAHSPDAKLMMAAGAVLRHGGLVAFPTETVYGLGARALDGDAVHRLFLAKGRPARNPVIVHVADRAGAVRVAEWSESAERLAERFWPGPLTLVLPRRPVVPDAVTAGGPTVAVRVPNHPVALVLLRETGEPVAAPSANRSSGLSPTCAAHVLKTLDGRIDLVLDGGPTPGGLESTVVDLTASPPRLLRPGLIDTNELAAVVGPLAHGALASDAEGKTAVRSPGLLDRHYAPRTPLETVEGDGGARVRELSAAGQRLAWLTFHGGAGAPADVLVVCLPPDPPRVAAELYAVLHRLDDLSMDRIVAELPPAAPEWLAVRDRLGRASA